MSFPAPPTNLPRGWEARWDPTQQRFFYIDHVARKTQWDPPPGGQPSQPPHQQQQQQQPFSPFQPFSTAAASGSPVQYAVNNAAPFAAASPVQYGATPVASTAAAPLQPSYAAPVAPVAFHAPQPSQPQQPAYHVAAAPPASVVAGAGAALAPVGQIGSIRDVAHVPLSLSEATWDQKQTGVGCSRCSKEFTFLNRRHRCRCCFREYCASCTVKSFAVPQFGHAQAVRVCDACYSHLSTNRKRCLSRLVPYFGRDNIPDTTKQEALAETYDMLTSGEEVLRDAQECGIFGPLLHVVEAAGTEKPNLAVQALSVVSLLTDLDNKNCAAVANEADAVPKLVAVVSRAQNPQARRLAAEVLNALARTPDLVAKIVAADYLSPCGTVLSGQYADAKLLDVVAETLASLVKQSEGAALQVASSAPFITNVLRSLMDSSLACQRSLLDVLLHVPAQALVRARAAPALVPLFKPLANHASLLSVVGTLAAADGGPEQLVQAGLLRELVPGETDPLVAVLVLLEKKQHPAIAEAVLPLVANLPDAGLKLCSSGQLGRLTGLLHGHFSEDVTLLALNVLSKLAVSGGDAAVQQMVDTGGLYDVVNHVGGAAASPSLQTAYLSVLQTLLRHQATVAKATDAGAVQALVPLALSSSHTVVRLMALTCLETMCVQRGDVRLLVVAVATAQAIVAQFLRDQEGVRVVRCLLEDPATNADLMQAGVFSALLQVVTGGPSPDLRATAAGALALCVQQNTTVDPAYIAAVAELMRGGGEVGVELLAAFSAQPAYRAFIVQQNLCQPLIALLLGGSPAAQRHAVLALANVAYDDAGSNSILREGGVSVLVGLIGHPVDQVQGCSLLALGNLARSPACRAVIVRDGGPELILERFASAAGLGVVVQTYCLWALRMLVLEKGVPERLAALPCLTAAFPRLALHVAQNSDSKPHAVGFVNLMCAAPAFAEALSGFSGRHDVLVPLLLEPGPGREWALREAAAVPMSTLLASPGFADALAALLSSAAPAEQRAGLNLLEDALTGHAEAGLRVAPVPLLVRLLPVSVRAVALLCQSGAGRAALRRHPGALEQLARVPGVETTLTLLCDAENASVLIQAGVVQRFAASNDPVCSEALARLVTTHAEARTALLSVPGYVGEQLLARLDGPSAAANATILGALVREPAFKGGPGVCRALLAAAGGSDPAILDTLALLPPADLVAEGALDRAVQVLLDGSAALAVRTKALLLLRRMSLLSLDAICRIPDIVSVLLRDFADNRAGLFLLDLVMSRGASAAFLAEDGVKRLLRNVPGDEVHANVCQVLHLAVLDAAFDRNDVPLVVEFCGRVLAADATAASGVSAFLALQLLRTLYAFAPEPVSTLVSSPAVVKRITTTPLLVEALRFFFQTT